MEVASKKKKSVSKTLSLEQEQRLAEWFSDRSLFYDQKVKSFKDKHLKNAMIDEQAKNFNLTGHELWQWWNSMRTMSGKINKKKSGQARIDMTPRQTWLVTNFGF